jgi:hypothetical protein
VGSYLFLAGTCYISLSVLLLLKREKPPPTSNLVDFLADGSSPEGNSAGDLTPGRVYARIFGLLKLPNMRKLIFVLMTNRVLLPR